MSEIDTSWFYSTPEATLRAESILTAFREDRIADIGAILATDYDGTGTNAVQLLVALICMVDRLADFGQNTSEHTSPELIREAARVVAAAYYEQEND